MKISNLFPIIPTSLLKVIIRVIARQYLLVIIILLSYNMPIILAYNISLFLLFVTVIITT